MNVFCWMDGQIVTGYTRLRSAPEQTEMDEEAALAAMTQNGLEQLRSNKIDEIMAAADSVMNQLTGKYPEAEKLSWTKQEAEALEKKGNQSAVTPLIDKLAAGRGTTSVLLATKIRKKAAAFTIGAGITIGERQRCEDLAIAAQTAQDLTDITFTMPGDFWVQVQAAYDAET